MHSMYLYAIATFFLFIQLTKQDESILSFEPSSVTLIIGKNKSIDIRLKKDLPTPITIQFLYDGKTADTPGYIYPVPNVTFDKATNADLVRSIVLTGHQEGHLVLTAQSSQVNISSVADYLLIDVARSNVINIFIQIVGWVYFAAWSVSFYPQIILNFQRRSVIGLNFDFLALNILGHSCYSVFNVVLYTSSSVQQEYFNKHPHGVLPVLLNDVIFSTHAVFACLVTVIQCLLYERGNQRVSYVARSIGGVFTIFLLISTIVSLTKHLSYLTLLYFFSYVKLAITIIKYCPQAWMNFRRKSTEGWSIGNILLDFTGGLLSLIQMFLLSSNYNDWSSIFGSPTKLGLGLFSILFDILFIIQHYVLYRNGHNPSAQSRTTNSRVNEQSPMLTSEA